MTESIQEKREARRRRKNEEPSEEENKGITESKGRATPSRRKGEVGRVTTTTVPAVLRPFNRVREYLLGVRSEMEKVTWPTREETDRLTRIVMAVLVAAAIFLGGLSALFTQLFSIGVDNPWVFILAFVGFLAALFGYARFSSQSETAEF
ncbi:MAG: preprotein translocase subunit SecE [Chloroflexota bacterium]